jgi:Cof subfamily protein (haloacid dehalogenase superfamily)
VLFFLRLFDKIRAMKNTSTKYLFFDVDGTLVNFKKQMPDSARRALRTAQAEGHKLILCTGRSEAEVYPFLMDFGFDGYIFGSGSHVIAGDREISTHVFGPDRMARVMDLLNRNNAPLLIQMADVGILSPNALSAFRRYRLFQVAETQSVYDVITRAIGKVKVDVARGRYADRYPDADMVVYTDAPFGIEAAADWLAPLGLRVTPSSLEPADTSAGEITRTDVDKGVALTEWMADAGAGTDAAIAFGDGPNDLEMLESAGTSVVVGNGVAEARERADFVTADIDDDGIAKAMVRLGLIPSDF